MRVDVDEAGRDGEPAGVDGASGRLALEVADGGDRVAGDADVGAADRRTGAVGDPASGDLDVEHGATVSGDGADRIGIAAPAARGMSSAQAYARGSERARSPRRLTPLPDPR